MKKLIDARSVRYLEAARVRHEIKARHGPDIGPEVSEYDNARTAQNLYDRIHREETTWDEAVREMGESLRDQVVTPWGDDRKTYFAKLAEKHWHDFHEGLWPK
ncbi:hypothetical protein [Nocardia sp. NPDC049149]|uniref:hypothetical protein n=1 Tax=Nocardia sp. NPDC049149 TaxID=3364315 RepID=UPI003715A562